MKRYTIHIFAAVLLFCASFAVAYAAPTTFKQLIEDWLIRGILARIPPLLIAVAVVTFIFGVFKFTIAQGAEDKESARSFIIYGIVGIFIMVSLWGLVRILQSTFNLNNSEIRLRETPTRF